MGSSICKHATQKLSSYMDEDSMSSDAHVCSDIDVKMQMLNICLCLEKWKTDLKYVYLHIQVIMELSENSSWALMQQIILKTFMW